MSDSEWRHPMCGKCWTKENGDEQPFSTVIEAPVELCCFCDATTHSGIYVRRPPQSTRCNGVHPTAAVLYRDAGKMWRLIQKFVMCECSQTSYAKLKGSQSMDIPVEFLALCEFAEELGVVLP